jgi:hypothetical protein
MMASFAAERNVEVIQKATHQNDQRLAAARPFLAGLLLNCCAIAPALHDTPLGKPWPVQKDHRAGKVPQLAHEGCPPKME